MKIANVYLLVLAVLTAMAFGCGSLDSDGPTKISSEQADASPAATVKSGKMTLNSELVYDLDDLGPFNAKLKEVFTLREQEGAFRQGSNEIEKSVYVLANPKIALGKIAEMTYNGGDFYFSRDKRPSGSESAQRPNPLTLILKTEDPQPEWIPNGSVSPNDMDQIACLVTFDPIKSPDLLKQARTIRNSIEIS
jgi:hypothetical protein